MKTETTKPHHWYTIARGDYPLPYYACNLRKDCVAKFKADNPSVDLNGSNLLRVVKIEVRYAER